MQEINSTIYFATTFPTSHFAIDMAVKGFALKLTNEIMRGCVGALDGLFIQMTAPCVQEGLGNVKSFFLVRLL